MNYEMLTTVEEARKRMSDEKSLKLYDARMDNLFKKDFHEFAKKTLALDSDWKIPQIRRFAASRELKEIVVWGLCNEAVYIYNLLSNSEYKSIPILYCDSRLEYWGSLFNGVRVISPSEFMSSNKESLVIIAPKAEFADIYSRLGNMFFPSERILFPEGIYGHHLYGVRGHQYFDFWKESGKAQPEAGEVFLDVGCLNGMTSVNFAKWCNGEYESIYAFEANSNMINACKEVFNKNSLHNVKIVNKAAWNTRDMLKFRADEGMYPGGSKVTEQNANIEVEADTIDNCLKGKRVTFVKMDIEGSEYNALIGAKKTLEKYKPRLAISIYHKPEDILEIPYIILKARADYSFAIRQYASNMFETVLYAW